MYSEFGFRKVDTGQKQIFLDSERLIRVGSDILIRGQTEKLEVGGQTYNWSILLLERKGEVSGLTLRTYLSKWKQKDFASRKQQ